MPNDEEGSWPLFATCSFPEFNPDTMPGVPVRTSNGFPRYTLKYSLVHKMPSTFPNWPWVRAAGRGAMSRDEFFARYIDLVYSREQRIRGEAAEIRGAEQIDDDVPLVLLCFDRLHKKGEWCHRSAFAIAWKQITGEEVPEFGVVRLPETAADQQPTQAGLF